MKFDIVRAWKDDSYRQSLNEEQLSMLPANPVGELTDAELATIFGTGGGGGPIGPGPVAGGPVAGGAVAPAIPAVPVVPVAHHDFVRNESIAVLCELNIFSISIVSNIAILGAVNQICIKG